MSIRYFSLHCPARGRGPRIPRVIGQSISLRCLGRSTWENHASRCIRLYLGLQPQRAREFRVRWRVATVREEAIKTVSESRTMLLTSRVRRQRCTTLLAAYTSDGIYNRHRRHRPKDRHHHPARSLLSASGSRLPRGNSSTRSVQISWRVYVMARVIDDSSFLTSLFLRENCDAASQWKWCLCAAVMLFFPFHAGAYDDVKLCRRVRGNSLNDLMFISDTCIVIYSESFRVYITLRFFYYSYYYFTIFSPLSIFIANHFPSNLRWKLNRICRNNKFTPSQLYDWTMELLSL